jgi:hypothetical protein
MSDWDDPRYARLKPLRTQLAKRMVKKDFAGAVELIKAKLAL